MKNSLPFLLLVSLGFGLWLASRQVPHDSVRVLEDGRIDERVEEPRAREAGPVLEPIEALAEGPEAERQAVPSTEPAPGFRRVHGQVVSTAGAGLAGAEVALLLQEGEDPEDARALERTATSRDGRFFLDAPEEGTLLVLVETRGYQEALVPVPAEGELRIVLEPRHARLTVVGRVTDGGRLLPEFLVRDQTLVSSENGIRGEVLWTTVTQSGTGFELTLATLGGDETWMTIRAKGFLEETRLLEATSDARVDVGEIALQRSSAHRGQVVDRTGAPIANATVQPLLEHGEHGPSATSSGDGGFEILTKEGREPSALYVSARHYAPAFVRLEEVGGFWDGVVVRLDAGTRIEGQVIAADGRPAVGLTLRAWLEETTGAVLPGGALGSSEWTRTVRTDEVGLYHFDDVPRGRVTVGVSAANSEAALGRMQTLVVRDDPLYLCDFTLGGGQEVRGTIEFPTREMESVLCLELEAEEGSERRTLASLEVPAGQPFVFEDVPLASAETQLVLRISVAPGFHVERRSIARGSGADFGTLRFADFTALTEFNQGERKVFELVSPR